VQYARDDPHAIGDAAIPLMRPKVIGLAAESMIGFDRNRQLARLARVGTQSQPTSASILSCRMICSHLCDSLRKRHVATKYAAMLPDRFTASSAWRGGGLTPRTPVP
jgi:hypothetical protein